VSGREIASSVLPLAVSQFWRKQQLKLVNIEPVDIFCILLIKITKFSKCSWNVHHFTVAVGIHNAIFLLYVRLFCTSMIRQQYTHVASQNAVCNCLHHLAFRWPCIVINSYNKTKHMHSFLNLFLEWNSTCFGQFLCPSSGVFHCIQQWYMSYSLRAGSTSVPSCSCSQAVSKSVRHIPLPCVQWKTPDDGQRNCSKHVEFHSKDKCEKLVHLVGFIIRNVYITLFCFILIYLNFRL